MAVAFGALFAWEAALVGAVLGYLMAQVLHMRQTLDRLLAQHASGGTGHEDAADPEPGPELEASSHRPPDSASDDRASEPAITTTTRATSTAATTAASEKMSPYRSGKLEQWLAPHIGAALAWLKRGNPLARIGIVVLFFGGAFLARYSADQGLFPLEARFAALGVAAIALVSLGWWLRRRNMVFALTLQGGGIAGFYLTVFAAMRVFALLPPTLAFGLMATIAAAAAVLAVAQDALALAFLGTVGGFAAPLLVSTGSGDPVALFSYYTVLNLGIFAIAWFRAWRELNLAGFVFTFSISGLFRATGYSPEQQVSTDGFLLLFFVLYVAISVLFSLRQKPDLKGYVSGSLVFGLPVVAFGLHASLVAPVEYGLAVSALGFGLFYATLAWALYLSGRDTLRLLVEAFAALAVIFASLAIPLAFDGQTTTAMWALEGAGLLWLGIRQKRLTARVFGVLLQLAGGLGLLADFQPDHAGMAVLNGFCLGVWLLTLAGLFSGYWLWCERHRLTRYEQHAATVAGLWALGWWLFGGINEILRTVADSHAYGALLLFGGLTALILQPLSRRLVWPLLELAAVVILAATIASGLVDLTELVSHPSARLGSIGWPALIMIGYLLLYRMERPPAAWFESIQPWPHAVLYWLLAILLSTEAAWQIGQVAGGVWPLLPWGLIPVALIGAIIRQPPIWPFNARPAGYRLQAAAPLTAFVLLWMLAINLGSDGATDGLGYLPLLNPLDIGVALVLLTTTLYWLSLEPAERRQAWPFDRRWLWGGVAGLVLIWLTAALLRSLHHLLGVPWDWERMTDVFLVQSSLSVFWGLLGMLTIIVAARRGLRVAWLAGAGLMAVVVVKLFAVDLTGTDTLARIVSFVSVGGLLLLAGFFAPLPPARTDSAADTRAHTDEAS